MKTLMFTVLALAMAIISARVVKSVGDGGYYGGGHGFHGAEVTSATFSAEPATKMTYQPAAVSLVASRAVCPESRRTRTALQSGAYSVETANFMQRGLPRKQCIQVLRDAKLPDFASGSSCNR